MAPPTIDTTQDTATMAFTSPKKSPQGFAFEVPVKSPSAESRWALLSARLERQAKMPMTPPKTQRPGSDDVPVLLSTTRKQRAEEANKYKFEAAQRAGEKQAQQVAQLAENLAAKFEQANAIHSSSVAERGARASEHNKVVQQKILKRGSYQEACQQRKDELIAKMRSEKAAAQPAHWRFKPSVGTWLFKPVVRFNPMA
jgi:hypothetical protein